MNFIFLVVTNNDSARCNGPLANGLINRGQDRDFRTAKTSGAATGPRRLFDPNRGQSSGTGLLPGLFEWVDHIARLVFGRGDNGQGVGGLELIDAIALDAAKLGLEHT